MDEQRLRRLYEQELLTETEIADRWGTYQVKISRLRKKWGIPTISAAERKTRRLPDLTPQQRELLVGSLLGDGWMSSSGPESARFQENHSLEQEEYLRWKADILGPFVSSFYDTRKKTGNKEYLGRGFSTTSCKQLRPYYDLYYPGPKRVRVFPVSLKDLMTPFALAVWYMDDGSLMSRFHPRVHFGLDDRSLKRALTALRKLGLRPKVHPEGETKGIHFPGQSQRFFDLVLPHMPECMGKKKPQESKRREQDMNAKRLTPEIAGELVSQGVPVRQVARLYQVGESTVRRRLRKEGGKPMGRPPRSITPESAVRMLGRIDTRSWGSLEETAQGHMVDDVYDILRRVPFPYPVKPPDGEARAELSRLQEKVLRLVEGEIRPLARAGVGLCTAFFPNRYQARYRENLSAFESWHREKGLKRAIRFQLKVGDPVLPHRVLRAVTMECRTPTVFRPGIAKYIYQRYASPGATVWDPCAGYGGRLLGALAAGTDYVGTDADEDTVENNLLLAEALGCSSRVSLVCTPAEEFRPRVPLTLVFTSPPYFNLERYSDAPSQSWKRYTSLESWVGGFLLPVFRTAGSHLSKQGTLAINIANRKGTDLVGETVKAAAEAGFRLQETLRMPLASLGRKKAWEPILIFKRD